MRVRVTSFTISTKVSLGFLFLGEWILEDLTVRLRVTVRVKI
jgi:hypothetical protein